MNQIVATPCDHRRDSTDVQPLLVDWDIAAVDDFLHAVHAENRFRYSSASSGSAARSWGAPGRSVSFAEGCPGGVNDVGILHSPAESPHQLGFPPC